jgi:hypothetical protein
VLQSGVTWETALRLVQSELKAFQKEGIDPLSESVARELFFLAASKVRPLLTKLTLLFSCLTSHSPTPSLARSITRPDAALPARLRRSPPPPLLDLTYD